MRKVSSETLKCCNSFQCLTQRKKFHLIFLTDNSITFYFDFGQVGIEPGRQISRCEVLTTPTRGSSAKWFYFCSYQKVVVAHSLFLFQISETRWWRGGYTKSWGRLLLATKLFCQGRIVSTISISERRKKGWGWMGSSMLALDFVFFNLIWCLKLWWSSYGTEYYKN